MTSNSKLRTRINIITILLLLVSILDLISFGFENYLSVAINACIILTLLLCLIGVNVKNLAFIKPLKLILKIILCVTGVFLIFDIGYLIIRLITYFTDKGKIESGEVRKSILNTSVVLLIYCMFLYYYSIIKKYYNNIKQEKKENNNKDNNLESINISK